MERDEALARLGLRESAERAEVDAAYKAAMKIVHPDVGASPDRRLAALFNEARDAALSDQGKSSTALVETRRAASDQLLRSGTAKAAPQLVLDTVVKRHAGSLALVKRQRWTAAAILTCLGVLAALVAAFGPFDATTLERIFVGAVAALCTAAAAAVGSAALRVHHHERQMALELEELGHTLSDRVAVSDTLDELRLGEFWTRAELHAALRHWRVRRTRVDGNSRLLRVRTLSPLLGRSPLSRSVPLPETVRRIGAVDFARLLMANSLELGLIEETNGGEGGRRATWGYRRIYPIKHARARLSRESTGTV